MRPRPPIVQLADSSGDWQQPEIADLRLLRECGLPVAAMLIIDPSAEEQYYRLNNLGSRLEELFREVDPSFPDDEEIEDLAPEAVQLLAGHFLLDEFVDGFYELSVTLPDRVTVRRPGGGGVVAARGRPSLLALKRLWQDDWRFESLWPRLETSGDLLPEPRPVLVHTAEQDELPTELHRDAAALIGLPIELLGSVTAGITAVRRIAAAGNRQLRG